MSTLSAVQRINGPSFQAQLSALDCRYGPLYSRRILVFRTSSIPDEIRAILEKALGLLVHKFPFLAGQTVLKDIGPNGRSRWKEMTPGLGLSLDTRNLSSELSFSHLDARDFSPIELDHDLLMPVPLEISPEPYHNAYFRVNFIEGGVLLAVCVAHVAADGVSLTEILRTLATYCKNITNGLEIVPSDIESTGFDRSSIVGLKSAMNEFKHHPGMSLRGNNSTPSAPRSDIPTEIVKIYRFNRQNLDRLKADASSSLRISTNDAMVSLIWRAVMRNRLAAGAVEMHQDVAIYPALSLRRVLGLPDTFIGNCVYNCFVRQPLSQLLGPLDDALRTTATLIRTEVNRVDVAIARGYIELAETTPSPSDFIVGAGPTAKTTSIVVSSLYHVNEHLTKEDWGRAFGGAIHRQRCSEVGYAGIMAGIQFVFPSTNDGQGGAEVHLSVLEKGIEALEHDDGWQKYAG